MLSDVSFPLEGTNKRFTRVRYFLVTRKSQCSKNMATSICRTLKYLQPATCQNIKCVASLLDVRLPQPVLVPIRTKKRYFIPPAVNVKQKTQSEQEDKARAAAGIFDPYVPPEGDARLSTLSREGLKQRTEQLRQSAASQLAFRKIKDHDTEFSTKGFDKEKLHSLVTERCYPEMVRGNRYKTLRWRFVESLEPPRVVHARCPDMVSKGNLYGQVTVRMHSRQTLAVYDRFGRLMLGDEDEPRDVLEYIVLERHLVNPYGRWRLHGKIVPAWAPPKDPIVKTLMIPGPKLKPEEDFADLNYQVPKPKAVQWSK
ncbi:39S ribosomal protein L45, mitochondrial [Labeo rohita]|uniref:Large ribosomal subunit protein mL45 n=1 Tax=Labeo rohita TaxID=84645 RepID=A0ABQ8MA03_LABRO|nr:39S ribosomal protein L45, mitochondrial [Labeo rohita]